MLSFRIVVVSRASAWETPANSRARSISERIPSGVTRMTATRDVDTGLLTSRVLASNFLKPRGNHIRISRVLLNDGQQARIEEPDLEQHQERHRAVDLIREG